uniref:Uncharacterized protein n=1 Tax=Mycena chlorophos TaxID=658473 RepID=A0ABQ0LXE0_MYCCL|nr:predicted protein [Mycena chlorophos]
MVFAWIRRLFKRHPEDSEATSPTATTKQARTKRAHEQARSDEIDEALKRDRFLFKDRKVVLVLGQEAAGKSTFMWQAKKYSERTTGVSRSGENLHSPHRSRPGSAGSAGASSSNRSKHSNSSGTGKVHLSRWVAEISFAARLQQRGTTMHTTLVRVRRKTGTAQQRKWLHLFGCAEALLYVVDLSCYDEWADVPETDETMVHSLLLSESLKCLSTIESHAPRDARLFGCLRLAARTVPHTRKPATSPLLACRCACLSEQIIVLNKVDLFRDKLAKIPLAVCFPEYEQPAGDLSVDVEVASAVEYVAQLFMSQVHSPSGMPERRVHALCMNVLDTGQLGAQFQMLGEVLYQERIRRVLAE